MTATVLVVEDEKKIRDLLRGMLERAGLVVVSTGSGAEAITLAGRAHPDLVVLDLGLPDVAGEDVAREIRRLGQVPILMLTAKSAEPDRVAGLELGADAACHRFAGVAAGRQPAAGHGRLGGGGPAPGLPRGRRLA